MFGLFHEPPERVAHLHVQPCKEAVKNSEVPVPMNQSEMPSHSKSVGGKLQISLWILFLQWDIVVITQYKVLGCTPETKRYFTGNGGM